LKPEIAVLHSLARSGGTLVSKCVACMPNLVLLSEIHPRHAFFDPLTQAHEWYGLLDREELAELQQNGQPAYLAGIRLIHDRCTALGKKLVIRDWTHVDFTPGPYPVHPSLQLYQANVLREHFTVRQIALVRDPLDSYLSLVQLLDYRGRLDVLTYLKGVRVFADAAAAVGFVRYEDFCADPSAVLETICSALNLDYDESYSERFVHYSGITGDSYRPEQQLTLTGERVGDRTCSSIRLPPHRSGYPELAKHLANHPDFVHILRSLGYDNP
jgi:hypothetical protein